MSIEAVEYVFKRMAATYGAEWERSIGTSPISDVKTVWSEALSSFTHSDDAKRAILWALDNLPERCPNSIQFRNLCRQAPAVERKQLPAPKADPERIKAELRKLTDRFSRPCSAVTDGRDWARRIIRRHEDGEIISPAALEMARMGLGGV
jgi:hypothetical protein